MNQIYKYLLSGGILTSFSLINNIQASANTINLVGTVKTLQSSSVVTNNAVSNTQINQILNQLGIDPKDVDVSNQTHIVDSSQINQINSNMPQWAKNIVSVGGQIGYLNLEIYDADSSKAPRYENIYYKLQDSTSVQTTSDILKKYGLNSSNLPNIGIDRWPVQSGQTFNLSYYVDPTLTVNTTSGTINYAQLVDQAANQWNNQLSSVGAPIKFVKSNSSSAVYKFNLGTNSTVVSGQALQGLSGRTVLYENSTSHLFLESYGVETYINNNAVSKNYTANQVVNVIAHEMGHSMGLEHTNNSSDLMYTAPQNQVLRQLDAVAVLIMYTTENKPGKGTSQIFG